MIFDVVCNCLFSFVLFLIKVSIYCFFLDINAIAHLIDIVYCKRKFYICTEKAKNSCDTLYCKIYCVIIGDLHPALDSGVCLHRELREQRHRRKEATVLNMSLTTGAEEVRSDGNRDKAWHREAKEEASGSRSFFFYQSLVCLI